jgi:hypothetical protein
MVLMTSSTVAAEQREHTITTSGCELYFTSFIGRDSRNRGGPLDRGSNKAPLDPMAFLVEQIPGSVIPAHYHCVDQWQVVIEGGGTLGRHAVGELTIHYSGEHSVYGPIIAGEKGLSYFTLRSRFDQGAHYMPGERDDLRRSRTVPPHTITKVLAPASREGLRALSVARIEELVPIDQYGIAAWRLFVPAASELPTIDPATGGGQSWLVLAGDLERNGETLPPRSCLFVTSDEGALSARAGSEGVEMLCLQYSSAAEGQGSSPRRLRGGTGT